MKQVDVFYSSTRRYQKTSDLMKAHEQKNLTANQSVDGKHPSQFKMKIGNIENKPMQPVADDAMIISDEQTLDKSAAHLKAKELMQAAR